MQALGKVSREGVKRDLRETGNLPDAEGIIRMGTERWVLRVKDRETPPGGGGREAMILGFRRKGFLTTPPGQYEPKKMNSRGTNEALSRGHLTQPQKKREAEADERTALAD